MVQHWRALHRAFEPFSGLDLSKNRSAAMQVNFSYDLESPFLLHHTYAYIYTYALEIVILIKHTHFFKT